MTTLSLLGALMMLQAVNPYTPTPVVKAGGPAVCDGDRFGCAVDLLRDGQRLDGVDAMHAAAAVGDVRAQRALGLMFLRGEYVAADQREAVRWFKRAASRGDRQSMDVLAKLYERGIGTAPDPAKAALWRSRAER